MTEEKPIDPERPIVDPHQHFWDIEPVPGVFENVKPFLLPEMLACIADSGHNVTHTVFVQCHAMYRADGPEELRCVGETEFANGQAAMSASGRYGPRRLAVGIVATADFRLGENVTRVLDAQIAAGGGRLRGIRMGLAYDESGLFGYPADPALKGLMRDATFRKGVAQMQPRNLTLDVWCVHSQLRELADLASAFPNLPIVLDHVGSPLNHGPYAGREKEVFAVWTADIAELARRPNVCIKLGGLGMDFTKGVGLSGTASSASLAPKWGPYIEACIAAFGPTRCMFESNFPPDNATSSYGALWNAFKLIVTSYSEAEKTALFSETAKRVYRIG